MPAGQRVIKRLWVVPLMLGLLWMGWQSGRMAWADALAQKGRLYQERWRTMKGDPPAKQQKAALLAYEKALRMDGDNPEYHERAGRILKMMADLYPLGSKERGQILEKARQHLLSATSLRPAWPYAWIDLALVDQMIGPMHHEELLDALVRAVKAGPWEQNVQRIAATLTVLAWPGLNQPQQEVLMRSVVYQSRYGDVTALARIVQLMHWESDFCPMIGAEKGWSNVCESRQNGHKE